MPLYLPAVFVPLNVVPLIMESFISKPHRRPLQLFLFSKANNVEDGQEYSVHVSVIQVC